MLAKAVLGKCRANNLSVFTICLSPSGRSIATDSRCRSQSDCGLALSIKLSLRCIFFNSLLHFLTTLSLDPPTNPASQSKAPELARRTLHPECHPPTLTLRHLLIQYCFLHQLLHPSTFPATPLQPLYLLRYFLRPTFRPPTLTPSSHQSCSSKHPSRNEVSSSKMPAVWPTSSRPSLMILMSPIRIRRGL